VVEGSTKGAHLRCAPAAERRGDPLEGTAAPAQRFLLVEQPGAWGRNAVRESRLAADVASALLERSWQAGARVLLIRRILREPPEPRRWAVADSRAGFERVWWGEFTDERELLQLDLVAPPGPPSDEPVFLVCTHGRHDACCAQRGWPVALALAGEYPQLTWQCSHVGGDRFAANLVILPHALYYGHLTPASAFGVVRDYADGRITPDFLRGRSIFGAPVQVAQHHARQALGETRIDALHPLESTRLDPHTFRVRLARGSDEIVVLLRSRETEPIARLTCASPAPSTVLEYELLSLDVTTRAASSAEAT
jgi:hypothetical protein